MTTTLILVHPGSLMGSANMNLGKSQAGAVRDGIQLEIEKHDGPIVVIDGAFSDELEWSNLGPAIEATIERNALAGHLALRIWGDDAGEAPYESWRSVSPGGWEGALVFGHQTDAATALAPMLAQGEIVVTGAWVDGDTGCVVSVERALRDALGADASISISDWAADMADAEIDDDESEDDFGLDEDAGNAALPR